MNNASAVTVQTLTYTYNTTGNGLNQLNTMSLDGTQIVSVSYDSLGRQSGYTYGNGTTGSVSFDSFQRQSGLSFALGGTSITSDSVTRDARTGMIIDQTVDGVDANTSGANFGYDRSGRLTNWWQRDPGSGNKYQGAYNFTGYTGTAPGCANTQWGRNSNRLSFEQKTYNSGGTLTATTVQSYCYDNADRLSTHVPASGTSPFNGVTYDSHGNIINMQSGNEKHGYDSADRHIISKLPGGAIEYVRDAADRIITRKLSGTVAARFVYTASADSPSLTLNSGGSVTERTISLPGGVLVTKRSSTANDVWSYPNIHGDVVATANGSGTKTGATRAYDPFGNLLGASTTPDNSSGPFDYGWHGAAQRPLEYSTGFTPLIEMGARQYSPLLGRFLEVDPVLGGGANDYSYPTDPVNMADLDGQCWGFAKNAPGCGTARKVAKKVVRAHKDAARWINKNKGHIGKWALRGLAVTAAAACIAASGGACLALTLAVAAGSVYKNAWDTGVLGSKRANWGRFAVLSAVDVGLSFAGGLPGRVIRSAKTGSIPIIANRIARAHGELPAMSYNMVS